jgi:nucleotide-binding universal stress UspA family protein
MSSAADAVAYTVVVGVDGSPIGQAALLWAIDEAVARHGRARVVHAWTSPYDWQMEVLSPVDEQTLRSAAQRRLDDALAAVDTRDVAVDTELIEGDPRQVLVDAAHDADLLVVGARGHGLVSEVLLGSVSSFCVHHAPCPVVVVPPHHG